MSGSVVTPRLVPPLTETPINSDTDSFNHAWAQHHQDIADALAKVHDGVTDGSEAAAGQVGEVLSAASTGAVTLTNNAAANVASLALTAGDWQVSGLVAFNVAPTTHPTQIAASISTASNTLQTPAVLSAAFNVGSALSMGAPPVRFNVSAATTVYLVALATFTTAGMSATGSMSARRMR